MQLSFFFGKWNIMFDNAFNISIDFVCQYWSTVDVETQHSLFTIINNYSLAEQLLKILNCFCPTFPTSTDDDVKPPLST